MFIERLFVFFENKLLIISIYFYRAVNEENNEANNVKNRLTGEWGKVPDTARYYKVNNK